MSSDHIEERATTAPVNDDLYLSANAAPDWRIWFGLAVTIGWLLMLTAYVANTIGWSNIGSAPIETLGNFLEGAFAPLAFLWLVIGYFLQKMELAQNTDAIRMQHVEIQKSAEQAVIQSEAIRATEVHARKQSFLLIAETVKQHLGGISAFLFLSSQGAEGGPVPQERIAELWQSLNNTDPEGFSRSLLQMRFRNGPNYAYKLLYGTEIRTRHCENFISTFERLLRQAEAADDDRVLRDAFLGTGHGRLYLWMIDFREDPPEGFTYGEYNFDPDSTD